MRACFFRVFLTLFSIYAFSRILFRLPQTNLILLHAWILLRSIFFSLMDAVAEHRARIREFFEGSSGGTRYRVALLSSPPPRRLTVAMRDIRKFSPELAEVIASHAVPLLAAAEEIAGEISGTFTAVGISGVVGKRETPRTLGSCTLGRLVVVEGIVTSTSIVRPKIKKTVHYNATGNNFACKTYRDSTTLTTLPPTSTAIPARSLDGHPLSLEFGLSEYTGQQRVVLQEMPERAPPGQMPRATIVVLEDDLAGEVKPGDRVRVTGIHRCISRIKGAGEALATAVVANHIEKAQLTPSIHQDSTALSILEALARSQGAPGLANHVAPSVFGHAAVKQAVLLQLLGGTRISTGRGVHLRGDINVLLVGDPGVAKSQILRCAISLAPISICATGRGASGVGLTAAITKDPETGMRRVEAGAMVLGDTGIVCIDEFDKMDEEERAAIHEAMEQQTVTVSKGGVHVTLNARCAVLAAANPVSGQYLRHKSAQENIRLPESLLSRFDLLFIIEDTTENDAQIAKHVMRIRAADSPGIPEDLEEEGDAGVLCTQPSQETSKSAENEKTLPVGSFTSEALRAFIQKARVLEPVISEEAASEISQAYVRLREATQGRGKCATRKVTARHLEALIRISTAHAKARLSDIVESRDVRDSVSLLEPTLCEARSTRSKKSLVSGEDVLRALYDFRENNPTAMIVSTERAAALLGKDVSEIMPALQELAKEEVIELAGGMIVFSG